MIDDARPVTGLLDELKGLIAQLGDGPGQQRALEIVGQLYGRLGVLPLVAWPMDELVRVQSSVRVALQRGKFASMDQWGKLIDWQLAIDDELWQREQLPSLEDACQGAGERERS